MSKYQEAKSNIVNTLVRQIGYEAYKNLYSEDFDTLQELVDKTTWVPVKKGLPDDRQVVLTIKNKHISILEYHADTKHWFETRENWWWSYNMVDAWMPLPKPYLGSDENDR
jgi:hypothetical protein|nr:MAG TPA: Protein of unknown function (DUF551) [Caudoviricetes sp.]